MEFNIKNMDEFRNQYMDFKPTILNKLSIERVKHMYSVAELMYKFCHIFKGIQLSQEECYLLGLNHDIGYINGGPHEMNGMVLFSGLSNSFKMSIIAECIRFHGHTPIQYMEARDILSNDSIPGELILLWWSDLMVESSGEHAGEIVGFKKRLEGIKERYGEDSKRYKNSLETVEWLIEYTKDLIL